ncbi:Mitochondrial Rho GTPase 1 [Trifolium repens]|nr:mitochondrial Rho GTPase [Trifolium repens]WJX61972.1 Mitochondrial Rho GTPase 1 [Trifolium repens]
MRLEAPKPISLKLGDRENIFRRILTAAEHPHLSIQKTKAWKTRKHYLRLIDQSVKFVSVSVGLGAAVAVGVGVARKNASG